MVCAVGNMWQLASCRIRRKARGQQSKLQQRVKSVRPLSRVGLSSDMNPATVYIPEKLFFKIGEVCDITGIQAHVLRYWESEFPTLAPQKNRAGQRTYRRRDVEMVLRIKELLYDDKYTIAGAKKRLTHELRGGKLKVVGDDSNDGSAVTAAEPAKTFVRTASASTAEEREGLKKLASELRELLALLEKEKKGN